MIRHIVFFKTPEGFTETHKLAEMLRNLESKINEIKEIEVGENYNTSERAFDISLNTLFESKEDLATYQKHADHIPVVEYVKSNNIKTHVVDYIVTK